MKTYTISGPADDDCARIVVNDDEMIVYDVCKISEYEGDDYVPRQAKKKGYVVLPIGNQDSPGDEGEW